MREKARDKRGCASSAPFGGSGTRGRASRSNGNGQTAWSFSVSASCRQIEVISANRRGISGLLNQRQIPSLGTARRDKSKGKTQKSKGSAKTGRLLPVPFAFCLLRFDF